MIWWMILMVWLIFCEFLMKKLSDRKSGVGSLWLMWFMKCECC